MRLVEQRAGAAQRSLRALEPRLVEAAADRLGARLARSLHRLELLAILEHHPMGVALLGGAAVVLLAGAEQHHQRGGGQEQREDHQAAAEPGEREAGDLAPVEEHPHAHERERHGQHHRQRHLRVALAPLARIVGIGLRLHQRLVGGGGCGEVLARQIDAVVVFSLLLRQRLDLVAQGAFGRGADLEQVGIERGEARAALGREVLRILPQGVALAPQLEELLIDALDRGALGRQPLDAVVGRLDALEHLRALGLELGELLVQMAHVGGLVVGLRQPRADVGDLRGEVGQRVGRRRRARGQLGQAALDLGERLGGAGARARSGGEQLGGHVGRAPERAELVGVEREHRGVGFLVDVRHQGGIPLEPVAVADAGQLPLAGRRLLIRGRA